jgi:hypothetical protein
LQCWLDLTKGEANMRMFSIALITLASLAQAQAEESIESRKNNYNCGYTINGYFHEVRNGESLCWRYPAPYYADYALLHCAPPLQEITPVKRGDPRCGGRYELRQ